MQGYDPQYLQYRDTPHKTIGEFWETFEQEWVTWHDAPHYRRVIERAKKSVKHVPYPLQKSLMGDIAFMEEAVERVEAESRNAARSNRRTDSTPASDQTGTG